MSINKWGGVCKTSMSWNSRRLKNGLCTEWQNHLYGSWYNHGLAIHGMSGPQDQCYIGVWFAPCFYDFSCFYNVIVRDPLFPQFVQNPSIYDVDKDSLYKEWSPRSIRIVPKSVNTQIMHQQNPQVAANVAQCSINKSRPVLINGVVYPSQSAAGRALGVNRSTISYFIKIGKAVRV